VEVFSAASSLNILSTPGGNVAKRRATSLEEIAAEVGRLFGTTESHTKKWLGQRELLLEALHTVREKASSLIDDMSGETKRQMKKRAKVQMAKTRVPAGNPGELLTSRKKRRMSAATRQKMRIAARKRGTKG
jgi:hypothetical protein